MLVGSYAPDLEGGAERQCRLLSKFLTDRGDTVGVIAPRHSIHRGEIEANNCIRLYGFGRLGIFAHTSVRTFDSWMLSTFPSQDSLSADRYERRRRAFSFWLTLPAVWLARLDFLIMLRRFVSHHSHAFDILHVHESGWLAGVGVHLGRLWKIPVICKESTTPALCPIGFDTPFRCTLDRRRKMADAWIAPTPAMQDELHTLGIPKDRIHLLPNGVLMPLDMASPEGSSEVIYVGNLTQGATWKAFDVLFDAWACVAKTRSDAHLTVVGGGDRTPWIRSLRHKGVGSSVHFTGHQKDLSQTYRTAGIFVLPSRVEGMSNALLEAMSWGLPCVVSDIPGNRSVIDHEVDGLIVPVNNASALAEAILRLLNNSEIRSSLGYQARKKIESQYDIHHVANELIEIYYTLINQKM